jgi:hypothetical protein
MNSATSSRSFFEPKSGFIFRCAQSSAAAWPTVASNGVNVTVSHRFENHGGSGVVKRSGRRFGGSAGRLKERGAEELAV